MNCLCGEKLALCVCVVIPFILDVIRFVDVPAGVTQDVPPNISIASDKEVRLAMREIAPPL